VTSPETAFLFRMTSDGDFRKEFRIQNFPCLVSMEFFLT